MSILRKAATATKQIALDETDFIVVKTDITKGEFNALAGRMSQSGATMTMTEALEFQKYLFDSMVIGWSLEVEPTVEEYEGLSAAAGNAVDEKLAAHFESLLPTSAEGK